MGQRLGKEKLMNYIAKFGFGEKTGIELSGEEDGILFKVDNMGPVETATTSFGQGVSAAINGGNLMTPYIVSSIISNETNQVITKTNPLLKRQVISAESSKLVRYALESVVALGTGRNAYIDGYRVGGKTGTAQKVQNGTYMEGNYILSFVGFLPADDPQLIVYVAIDNPKGVTQYGGTVAAPIAKNIMTDAIEVLNIPKRKSEFERVYNWYDVKYFEVPDITNMIKEEAQKQLKNFTINYSGNGDKIIYQSPKSGEYLKSGGIVSLMLGN